jgi:hypothetical protein
MGNGAGLLARSSGTTRSMRNGRLRSFTGALPVGCGGALNAGRPAARWRAAACASHRTHSARPILQAAQSMRAAPAEARPRVPEAGSDEGCRSRYLPAGWRLRYLALRAIPCTVHPFSVCVAERGHAWRRTRALRRHERTLRWRGPSRREDHDRAATRRSRRHDSRPKLSGRGVSASELVREGVVLRLALAAAARTGGIDVLRAIEKHLGNQR